MYTKSHFQWHKRQTDYDCHTYIQYNMACVHDSNKTRRTPAPLSTECRKIRWTGVCTRERAMYMRNQRILLRCTGCATAGEYNFSFLWFKDELTSDRVEFVVYFCCCCNPIRAIHQFQANYFVFILFRGINGIVFPLTFSRYSQTTKCRAQFAKIVVL